MISFSFYSFKHLLNDTFVVAKNSNRIENSGVEKPSFEIEGNEHIHTNAQDLNGKRTNCYFVNNSFATLSM